MEIKNQTLTRFVVENPHRPGQEVILSKTTEHPGQAYTEAKPAPKANPWAKMSRGSASLFGDVTKVFNTGMLAKAQ